MARPVAWCLEPPRFTRDHLTNDDRWTLCGLRVPTIVFNIDRGGNGEPCRRCEAADRRRTDNG